MKKNSIFLLLMIAFASCKKHVETWRVKEQRLNEAVYASGQLMPEHYYFLKSQSAERILALPVSEGATVNRDQVLTVLGNPSQNNKLTILHEQVSLAKQNVAEKSPALAELRNKIQFAKEKYLQDSVNAQRYLDLSKTKAVSQKDADQAKITALRSLAEYENYKQQYHTQRLDLKNKVLATGEQLAQFNQQYEQNTLKSPFTGTVYSINLKEGEIAQPNETIMMIGSPGEYKLELLVDERDIIKVKLGQKVWFEADAFGGKQFQAKINKINPVSQKETRSFSVEAEVLGNGKFLPQCTVEANILIQENLKSLIIPVEYLIGEDSVNIQSGDKNKKIKVTPGFRNGNFLQIEKGLRAGDVIVKPIK